MAVSSRDVLAVQACYPLIYLACHVAHVRRAASPARISANESAVLAHLDSRRPVRLTGLAAHLGISKSSLSATIKRLEALGYVERTLDPADRRSADLRLTQAGRRAMSLGSVLDTRRVALLLARLTPNQRACAIDGLRLLARAASSLSETRTKPEIKEDRL